MQTTGLKSTAVSFSKCDDVTQSSRSCTTNESSCQQGQRVPAMAWSVCAGRTKSNRACNHSPVRNFRKNLCTVKLICSIQWKQAESTRVCARGTGSRSHRNCTSSRRSEPPFTQKHHLRNSCSNQTHQSERTVAGRVLPLISSPQFQNHGIKSLQRSTTS